MAISIVRKVVTVILSIMVVLAVAAPYAEGNISCSDIISRLTPCLGYLQSGGVVPAPCCSVVKALNSLAKTTPDRRTACACLKRAAGSVTGINPSMASSLPGKCGVNIGYPISYNVDCSK
ncbi:hypothetical protein ACHQM5_024925 [Ranunculus cassubicifolius]